MGKTTQKILTNIGNLEIVVSPDYNVRSLATSTPSQELNFLTGRVRMVLKISLHLKDEASVVLRSQDGMEQEFQVHDCNYAPTLEAGFQKTNGETLDVHINLKFDRTLVPVKFNHWNLIDLQSPILDGEILKIPVDLTNDKAEVLFSQIERKTGLARGSFSIGYEFYSFDRDLRLAELGLSEITELTAYPNLQNQSLDEQNIDQEVKIIGMAEKAPKPGRKQESEPEATCSYQNLRTPFENVNEVRNPASSEVHVPVVATQVESQNQPPVPDPFQQPLPSTSRQLPMNPPSCERPEVKLEFRPKMEATDEGSIADMVKTATRGRGRPRKEEKGPIPQRRNNKRTKTKAEHGSDDDDSDPNWTPRRGRGPRGRPRKEEVFCTCRQPQMNLFMLQCCTCQEWYHGKCVGVTEKQADGWKERNPLHKWYCSRTSACAPSEEEAETDGE